MTISTFISLLILSLFFLAACTDSDDSLTNGCIEISQNPDWKTEDFKTSFTIQFPDNYEGVGMTGFEGNSFSKKRNDGKIELEYYYSNGAYSLDFGIALNGSIPDSIDSKDKSRSETILAIRKEFCSNNDIIGYFYFNEEVNSTGKYFMKRDSVYLEGLKVYFNSTELQEVENIIKTVVEK